MFTVWRLLCIVHMDHTSFSTSVFQAVVFSHHHAMLFQTVQLFWLVVQQSFCFQTVYELHDVSYSSTIQDSLSRCFNADFSAIYDDSNIWFQVFITFNLFLQDKMNLLIFLVICWNFLYLFKIRKSIIRFNKIKFGLWKQQSTTQFVFVCFYLSDVSSFGSISSFFLLIKFLMIFTRLFNNILNASISGSSSL